MLSNQVWKRTLFWPLSINGTRYVHRHRSLHEGDMSVCKRVDGRTYEERMNIGFRYEKDIISVDEEASLVDEMNQLKEVFGFLACETQSVSSEVIHLKLEAFRVTGRPESRIQKLAPWGYAETFQRDNLSQNLRNYVERLEHSKKFAVDSKTLRDVTINYRSNSMFCAAIMRTQAYGTCVCTKSK